jgi:hypothetical protein
MEKYTTRLVLISGAGQTILEEIEMSTYKKNRIEELISQFPLNQEGKLFATKTACYSQFCLD